MFFTRKSHHTNPKLLTEGKEFRIRPISSREKTLKNIHAAKFCRLLSPTLTRFSKGRSFIFSTGTNRVICFQNVKNRTKLEVLHVADICSTRDVSTVENTLLAFPHRDRTKQSKHNDSFPVWIYAWCFPGCAINHLFPLHLWTCLSVFISLEFSPRAGSSHRERQSFKRKSRRKKTLNSITLEGEFITRLKVQYFYEVRKSRQLLARFPWFICIQWITLDFSHSGGDTVNRTRE